MSAKMAFWAPAGVASVITKDQAFAELETYFKSTPNTLDFATLSANPNLKKAVEVLFNNGKPLNSLDEYSACAKPVNAELGVYMMSFTGGNTKNPLTTISQRTIAELNKPANQAVKSRLLGQASPSDALAARSADVAAAAVAAEPASRVTVFEVSEESAGTPAFAVWQAKVGALESSDAFKKYYNPSSVTFDSDDPLAKMKKELAKKSPDEGRLQEYYQGALSRIYYGAVASHYLEEYSIHGSVKFNFAAEKVYNVESAITAIYGSDVSLAVLNAQIADISKLELQTPGKKTSPLLPLLAKYGEMKGEGFEVAKVQVPTTDGKKEVAQFGKDLDFLRRQYEDNLARAESKARTQCADSLDQLYFHLFNHGLAPKVMVVDEGSKDNVIKVLDPRAKRIAKSDAAPSSFDQVFEKAQAAITAFSDARKKAGASTNQSALYVTLNAEITAADTLLLGILKDQQQELNRSLSDARAVVDKVTDRGALVKRAESLAIDIGKILSGEAVDLPTLKPAIAQLKADAQTAFDAEEEARRAEAAKPVPVKDSAERAIGEYKRVFEALPDAKKATLSFFGTPTITAFERDFKNASSDEDYARLRANVQAKTQRLQTLAGPVVASTLTFEQEAISNINNPPGVSVSFESPSLRRDLDGKKVLYSIILVDSRGNAYLSAVSGSEDLEYAAKLQPNGPNYDIVVHVDPADGGLLDAQGLEGDSVKIGTAQKTGDSWSVAFDSNSPYLRFVQGTISNTSIQREIRSKSVNTDSVTIEGFAAPHTKVKRGDQVFADAKLVEE